VRERRKEGIKGVWGKINLEANRMNKWILVTQKNFIA
jgi:hypothetical protein